MRMSNILKMGAFGTILRGRRHQGRHRGRPTAGVDARPGRADVVAGDRRPATMGHQGTAIQDFYVVSPNFPALPERQGSKQGVLARDSRGDNPRPRPE
jgi:hypothetical protein